MCFIILLQSSFVPEWMFLSWVNQILACLDSPCVLALEPLILLLADAYPNAVKFPFRITKEKFKVAVGEVGICSNQLVDR